MNIFERVRNSKLTKKQLQVIEAILDDLEFSSFLSGHEICEKYKVSFSSLTRLSKSLGLSGFPELKREIERNYKDEFSPSSKAESFILDAREKSIFNIVLNFEIRNLNKISNHVHETDLVNTAKKIKDANRVFIIGVGQLSFIVSKLSQSLKLLGKDTICFTELGFSKGVDLYSVTSDDIFICFSINNELIEFSELLDRLKEISIESILFTDRKTGRLRSKSALSFYIPASGHGMINCLTSFIVITNILESILFSLDKHTNLAKIKNIEKKWNSLPNF